MNKGPEDPPDKELPLFDRRGRPFFLPDGWQYADEEGVRRVGPYGRGEYVPPPAGPGTFLLPFEVYDEIRNIEVHYHFDSGHEAEIQAAGDLGPAYKIFGPEGSVIIPVGTVREWVLRLPAGTSVHAYIDKWQWDQEELERQRQQRPELTPEQLELGEKLLAEYRERRKRAAALNEESENRGQD
ncbi:hypothetical protein CfE428DRAFT_5579 [Chthoniobacter flavus Ellin428]|uniref:Uncharacterized protein n=1 Tax=Chthoniobacter flavus Ellin428 TaxID=497964 RepID=B4D9I9_9BACT|nr:hypothetical protein [Chthoniobacter flavus]EDY16950.1 hypothetical protein CfE428DRAFT_5579 [Chthoniobacter flavus Ellin428]TCO87828.1 hypothetical protein EV701_120127 [Chthoniobacter flavus]